MSSSSYYKIEQQKLFLEAEKISLFTKHAPTIGSYREEILREYIRKITPSSLKVTSGFVSSNEDYKNLKDGQSRQIDILIYDSDSYVPLIEAGGLSVIRPESLLGCIEIKSTLTFYKKKAPKGAKKTCEKYPLGGGYTEAYRWAGTLVDALVNIKDCADACTSRKEAYFNGILAFESNFEIRKLYQALDNEELQQQLGIDHLRQLPTAICILSKSLSLFFDADIFQGPDGYNDEYESYYNEFTAIEGHEEYPFQFFTVQAYNQIGYTHSRRAADTGGLFTAVGARAGIWSNHFRLNCSDM